MPTFERLFSDEHVLSCRGVRVVGMLRKLEPMPTLERILSEDGPMYEDDIARRLRDGGVADADAVLDEALYEIDCPTGQLVDDRWVWLPALLAGRVFAHRLGAAELAHDILTVTPDLDPITALCEHEQYRQLADGSPAQVVLPEVDHELLEQRGIPFEVIDPSGALLLAPGTLEALGVAEGDLIGIRLTEPGLVVERVAPVADHTVAARLAATLDDDEPVYICAAVWTACAEDAEVFTEPLPPLSEIIDDYGLAQDGDWLAPGGFDFDSWHFDRECAALGQLHDLDPEDAFALYTLIKLYEHMALVIEATDTDEPPGDELAAAGAGAPTPQVDDFDDIVGELGAPLADPRLADLFLEETVAQGCRRSGRARHVRRDAGAKGATCGAGRGSLAAGDGAWNGPATSKRPNASGWRPSRWIPIGRCHCWIWPASPPIAETSNAGWPCCAAPVPDRTTRWWSLLQPVQGRAAYRHRPKPVVLVRVRPQIQKVSPRE